eukprot:gnl/Chilomastix_cuspidata/2520.p1 GENE.gnl/Chilomastix_cuspidata/2520~~gnl/Chilomastix_cuspidata/2520.p1  ORF type:complete len:1948 (+),score=876.82 gnl/Chilomastix_cuspidata/2520:35-5878(+)
MRKILVEKAFGFVFCPQIYTTSYFNIKFPKWRPALAWIYLLVDFFFCMKIVMTRINDRYKGFNYLFEIFSLKNLFFHDLSRSFSVYLLLLLFFLNLLCMLAEVFFLLRRTKNFSPMQPVITYFSFCHINLNLLLFPSLVHVVINEAFARTSSVAARVTFSVLLVVHAWLVVPIFFLHTGLALNSKGGFVALNWRIENTHFLVKLTACVLLSLAGGATRVVVDFFLLLWCAIAVHWSLDEMPFLTFFGNSIRSSSFVLFGYFSLCSLLDFLVSLLVADARGATVLLLSGLAPLAPAPLVAFHLLLRARWKRIHAPFQPCFEAYTSEQLYHNVRSSRQLDNPYVAASAILSSVPVPFVDTQSLPTHTVAALRTCLQAAEHKFAEHPQLVLAHTLLALIIFDKEISDKVLQDFIDFTKESESLWMRFLAVTFGFMLKSPRGARRSRPLLNQHSDLLTRVLERDARHKQASLDTWGRLTALRAAALSDTRGCRRALEEIEAALVHEHVAFCEAYSSYRKAFFEFPYSVQINFCFLHFLKASMKTPRFAAWVKSISPALFPRHGGQKEYLDWAKMQLECDEAFWSGREQNQNLKQLASNFKPRNFTYHFPNSRKLLCVIVFMVASVLAMIVLEFLLISLFFTDKAILSQAYIARARAYQLMEQISYEAARFEYGGLNETHFCAELEDLSLRLIRTSMLNYNPKSSSIDSLRFVVSNTSGISHHQMYDQAYYRLNSNWRTSLVDESFAPNFPSDVFWTDLHTEAINIAEISNEIYNQVVLDLGNPFIAGLFVNLHDDFRFLNFATQLAYGADPQHFHIAQTHLKYTILTHSFLFILTISVFLFYFFVYIFSVQNIFHVAVSFISRVPDRVVDEAHGKALREREMVEERYVDSQRVQVMNTHDEDSALEFTAPPLRSALFSPRGSFSYKQPECRAAPDFRKKLTIDDISFSRIISVSEKFSKRTVNLRSISTFAFALMSLLFILVVFIHRSARLQSTGLASYLSSRAPVRQLDFYKESMNIFNHIAYQDMSFRCFSVSNGNDCLDMFFTHSSRFKGTARAIAALSNPALAISTLQGFTLDWQKWQFLELLQISLMHLMRRSMESFGAHFPSPEDLEGYDTWINVEQLVSQTPGPLEDSVWDWEGGKLLGLLPTAFLDGVIGRKGLALHMTPAWGKPPPVSFIDREFVPDRYLLDYATDMAYAAAAPSSAPEFRTIYFSPLVDSFVIDLRMAFLPNATLFVDDSASPTCAALAWHQKAINVLVPLAIALSFLLFLSYWFGVNQKGLLFPIHNEKRKVRNARNRYRDAQRPHGAGRATPPCHAIEEEFKFHGFPELNTLTIIEKAQRKTLNRQMQHPPAVKIYSKRKKKENIFSDIELEQERTLNMKFLERLDLYAEVLEKVTQLYRTPSKCRFVFKILLFFVLFLLFAAFAVLLFALNFAQTQLRAERAGLLDDAFCLNTFRLLREVDLHIRAFVDCANFLDLQLALAGGDARLASKCTAFLSLRDDTVTDRLISEIESSWPWRDADAAELLADVQAQLREMQQRIEQTFGIIDRARNILFAFSELHGEEASADGDARTVLERLAECEAARGRPILFRYEYDIGLAKLFRGNYATFTSIEEDLGMSVNEFAHDPSPLHDLLMASAFGFSLSSVFLSVQAGAVALLGDFAEEFARRFDELNARSARNADNMLKVASCVLALTGALFLFLFVFFSRLSFSKVKIMVANLPARLRLRGRYVFMLLVTAAVFAILALLRAAPRLLAPRYVDLTVAVLHLSGVLWKLRELVGTFSQGLHWTARGDVRTVFDLLYDTAESRYSFLQAFEEPAVSPRLGTAAEKVRASLVTLRKIFECISAYKDDVSCDSWPGFEALIEELELLQHDSFTAYQQSVRARARWLWIVSAVGGTLILAFVGAMVFYQMRLFKKKTGALWTLLLGIFALPEKYSTGFAYLLRNIT